MAKEDWKNIDLDTLTADEGEAWRGMKAAYRQYAEAKALFEEEFRGRHQLPEGLELKFGYNFGKLSVAIGPKREGKARVAEVKESLSDWIAEQIAHGRGH